MPHTKFAPAERAGFSQVAEDYLAFCDSKLAPAIDSNGDGLFLVLNGCRQLIYANSGFLAYLGLKSPESILGLRLGEIFECLNAIDCLSGCGTRESCCDCRALIAVMGALRGNSKFDTCSIVVRQDRKQCIMKFGINTSPFDFKGQPCIAVTLTQPSVSPMRRK